MSLIPHNLTVAAPLAGISNTVYRRWARKYGAGLVFTEMVSAEGVRRGDSRTLNLLRYSETERPIVAQLFDDTPEAIRDAAFIVEERGFDGIDINMGCPAKKVVSKGAGAALLKDISRAVSIVSSVKNNVELPVSVKLRSGWTRENPASIKLIREFSEMGVEFVTLHPRSRDMFFRGKSDWNLISRAVDTTDIPIIGNGDIFCADDALRMLNTTGCAALMIGRASMGNPWIFGEVSSAIGGGIAPEKPDDCEVVMTCRRYVVDLIDYFGEKLGTNISKKHLAWFTSGMPNARDLRARVFSAKTAEYILSAIDDFAVDLSGETYHKREAVRCQ